MSGPQNTMTCICTGSLEVIFLWVAVAVDRRIESGLICKIHSLKIQAARGSASACAVPSGCPKIKGDQSIFALAPDLLRGDELADGERNGHGVGDFSGGVLSGYGQRIGPCFGVAVGFNR